MERRQDSGRRQVVRATAQNSPRKEQNKRGKSAGGEGQVVKATAQNGPRKCTGGKGNGCATTMLA